MEAEAYSVVLSHIVIIYDMHYTKKTGSSQAVKTLLPTRCDKSASPSTPSENRTHIR